MIQQKILWHLPFVYSMYKYRKLYSVPVHMYHEQWEGVTRSFTVSCTYTTMNKEAVSRDFYCMQPWKRGCIKRYFTVSCTCVYYVYVDNYCNITCWLLFQLCFARVYISLPAKKLIWYSTLYNQPLFSLLYKVKDLMIQLLFHGCIQ